MAGLLALMQTRRSRDGVIGVCVLGCRLDDRRIVVQFLLIPVTGRSKARVESRVLYIKDKGTSKDNQDKETSMEKVQRENKRRNSAFCHMYLSFMGA